MRLVSKIFVMLLGCFAVGSSTTAAAQAINKMHLLRYNSTGALDATFGSGGQVILAGPNANGARANDVVARSDGKLYVGGSTKTDGPDAFVVARLNSNGTPDQSFSSDGFAVVGQGEGGSAGDVIQYGGAGHLLAVGTLAGPNSIVATVARFDGNGSPVRGFGNAGVAQVPTPGWSAYPNSVAVMPDSGRIVVAGTAWRVNSFESQFFVARLRPDGTLDTTFSGDGVNMVSFPNATQASCTGMDIKIGPGGETTGYIALGGAIGITRFAIAVLGHNGELLNSFDSDGRKEISYTSNGEHIASALRIDSAGRIVLAGSLTRSDGNQQGLVMRVMPSGSMDQGFNGGSRSIDFPNVERDRIGDIHLRDDGSIVAVGAGRLRANGTGAWHYIVTVAAVRSDGAMDLGFSADGMATFDDPLGETDAFGVTVDPSNRIVVVGQILR